ncbi:MAG TPA: hypothetical protein VL947_04040 [Cytophagales bacterium]|nr:hypothetical protein [Cytophagales bacterium]
MQHNPTTKTPQEVAYVIAEAIQWLEHNTYYIVKGRIQEKGFSEEEKKWSLVKLKN